jgi:hypothetical protein
MSNIILATSENGTTLSFSLTGQSGNSGISNITIPKAALFYQTAPVIYIDSDITQNQGYTEDASNFYVWYITHFSTHAVAIIFPRNGELSDSSSSITYGIVACIIVAFIVSLALIFMKRTRCSKK